MGLGFAETQGFPYSFQRGELHVGSLILTRIMNVKADQPTENEPVHGTSPEPFDSTEGFMNLGDGTITFSDFAEVEKLLSALGDGYRSQKFSLMWILRAEGRPDIKIECSKCQLLSNPIDHSHGAPALGGDVGFSFVSHKINGKSPHKSTQGSTGNTGGVGVTL